MQVSIAMQRTLKISAPVLAMAWAGIFQTAIAAEPVKLTVGYQPYDTISYSAAVIRALELWKKYLPPGSEVEFQNALQGSIIVNQMLANKQQIGYLGDMPAVVSTTKRQTAHINLVANTGFSPGQRCNVIMVRVDAPDFKSTEEALKWLDGKTLAVPKGSCADRFLGNVLEKTKIKPEAIMNQSLEVLATNPQAEETGCGRALGAHSFKNRKSGWRRHREICDYRPFIRNSRFRIYRHARRFHEATS
jgi:NitT/TauT family transport system substrate-binding protein